MAISPNLQDKDKASLIESTETANQAARAIVNPDGTNVFAGLLSGVTWDFLQVTYPTTTTETFTFKDGGSGGTTEAVVTITYTDTSKDDIDTVERTT